MAEEHFTYLCFEGGTDEIKKLCQSHPELVRQTFARFGPATGSELWRFGGKATGLHLAASKGRVDCCRVLLDHGADIEARDGNSNTPLMYSSDYGVLKLLLMRGANVNAKSSSGWTALHFCAYHDWSIRALLLLVSAGADIGAVNDLRDTPQMVASYTVHAGMAMKLAMLALFGKGGVRKMLLHFISEFSDEYADEDIVDDIEMLVGAGADLEARDKEQWTPLFTAIFQKNISACRKLIELGANVNAEDTTRNGLTPLSLALRSGGNLLVTVLLIEQGAAFNEGNIQGLKIDEALLVASESGCPQAVSKLCGVGANVENQDKLGNTALHLAAKNGHTATLWNLIKAGAIVNARNAEGHTAHLLALINGQLEAAATLIEAGADANSSGTNDCDTALLIASMHGLRHAVQALIKAGADIQASDQDGNTSLLLAIKNGFEKLASNLVEAGVNIHACNKSDETALSLASKEGHGSLCCQLVNHGAKVDGTISFFRCMEKATNAGNIGTLGQFLELGVSVNLRGNDGSTVLHKAAAHHKLDTVRYLLDHGADIAAADNLGYTPLHNASAVFNIERHEVIQLLLAKGADPTAKTALNETPRLFAKRRYQFTLERLLEKAELAHELISVGGKATKPTTVTIRFGGPPGAGKSTLTDALQVTRARSVFRYERQADEAAANMQRRTKGINCRSFTDEHSSQFSIFDLGGHGEFLATHQTFIGDGSVPVIDCVVVSALDDSLEGNALKWCSLFASRNLPTLNPWPLLLVATRADKMTEEQQHAVFGVFHTIKNSFADYFRFPLEEPLFVDARKSWSELTVALRRTLSELHSQLTGHSESPWQPSICQSIADHIPALRKKTSAPVVTKEEFIELMRPHIGLEDREQAELSESALRSLFNKALQFLTGYATVLSFQHTQAANYIVIDPPWLLSDIVGRLMVEPPLPGPYIHYDNGYAKKADVVAALKTTYLPGETTFEMVASLGFCLEQRQLEKVLNPSKLLGARASGHWPPDSTMVVHAGRRLKCKGTVAIASAFFPHLQVHFYHRYLAEYDEELPMWNGGIRLVAGERTPAEALIEAHPAHTSIDIIVRGRAGSERACTDLLRDLTEETLRKAVDISPGSQLSVFYLSRRELSHLSPTGLESRPCVEYSTERVKRAIQQGNEVTDGKASSPESPFDLLLSLREEEQFMQPEITSSPSGSSNVVFKPIPDETWRVVLLNLAKGVNSFEECDSLASCLAVNDREGDVVKQLRQVNPHRSPPEMAVIIFNRWFQQSGGQTSEMRHATLRRIFRDELRRPRMCTFLDDELKAAGCVEEDEPE